jgi:hypothetical protein
MPVTLNPCPSDPFIKLGADASKAPTLNYRLEQENALPLFSYIPVDIPKASFTDYANATPPLGTIFGTATAEEIGNMLVENIGTNPDAYIAGLASVKDSSSAIVFFKKLKPINNEAGKLESIDPSVSLPKYKTNSGIAATVIAVLGNSKLMQSADASFEVNDYTVGTKLAMADLPILIGNDSTALEIDIDVMAKQIANGYYPVCQVTSDGSPALTYVRRPSRPNPTLFIKHEMQLCSYLGNYGAGRTINTFSLLPGEKTSISVRTFKESSIQKSKAENILDSMSQASSNSFENSLQAANSFGMDTAIAATASMGFSSSIGASIPIKIASVSANYGINAGLSISSATSSSIAMQTVSNALSNHVSESNKNREVSINTSTFESSTTSEETTIVRELENVNVSRTLNFVFRQLMQEMHSVLWLKDIKFCYSNGMPGSYDETFSEGLDDFLARYIAPTQRVAVLTQLLKLAGWIFNYEKNPIQFFECKNFSTNTIPTPSPCTNPSIPASSACLYVKRAGLKDTYKDNPASPQFTVDVPGVVLGGSKHVFRTNSVIVDSLLGQGEALDCYNMHLQEEAVKREILGNERLQQEITRNNQAMAIIDNITDPLDKAKNYKKIFGDCCEVAQSGCGCAKVTTPTP